MSDGLEHRLRLALRAANLGTWAWDAALDRLAVNPRHEEICGFAPGTQPDRFAALLALVWPEDRGALTAGIAAARASGADYEQRFRLRRHGDGALRWVEARGCFFRDAAGALVGTGTLQDVTQEVDTHARLLEQEQRLALALDAFGGSAWEWDLGADTLVGGPSAGARAWNAADTPDTVEAGLALIHPDDVDVARAAREAVLREETDRLDVEARVKGRDGVYRWLSTVGRVVARDPEGRARRVMGITYDVTRRRTAQDALLAQKTFLENILSNLPIMVGIAEPGVGFVWVNAAWEKTLGWRIDELAGLDILAECYPDEEQRGEVRAFMELADGTTWRRFSTRVRSGRTIETSWCNVRLPDGRTIGFGQDVSFEAQLLETQKLESLGVLAGGIAHDFNNLLVGILGNVGMALGDVPPESRTAATLADVEAAAQRLADLTRQLLAYAGKGRFVVQPIDLCALVREMRGLLAAVVSKRATIRVDLPSEVPQVFADSTQIRQLVMNLITNASDALGDTDGVITLRVGLLDVDAEYLRTTFVDDDLAPGRYVWLEVMDTGAGMPPEIQRRIFEPFFTTKFTGRGLGLAATLGIVRGHKGTLKVYSEPGKGSVFKLLLPAYVPESPPAASGPRGAESAPSEGAGVVLVVDDEPTVQRAAQRILERRGFRVISAVDGRDALRKFDAHHDEIWAVLLDLTMPHLDGEQTMLALRERDPNVRVVLTSGYNQQDVTTRFVGAGFAGFLQKPFVARELLDAIDAVIRPPMRRG